MSRPVRAWIIALVCLIVLAWSGIQVYNSPTFIQSRRIEHSRVVGAQLQRELRADSRFSDITLSASTDETIWISGSVATHADATALLEWAHANIEGVPFRWVNVVVLDPPANADPPLPDRNTKYGTWDE